jgi:MFS family permease
VETKNRNRLSIHILVTLVRICVGLVWASAGPLLPFLMREYDISRGAVGWYASAAPIAVAILAIPIGIIGARFSLKKMFAIGALFQAAGIFAPFCTSYPLILLTRIGYALGTAITVPVATAILAEWFTARELPLVNGITISFVSLGNTSGVRRHCTYSYGRPFPGGRLLLFTGVFALPVHCPGSYLAKNGVKRQSKVRTQV